MSSPDIIRIATRASELALRQANQVASRLAALGMKTELATYKTAGDRNLTDPLSKIGAKGLFTKELEEDLLRGKVHCCVHSLKDLPTEMPPGLGLGAVLEREDPRDVLVVNANIGVERIDQLPRGSRVGTSSLRRRAQLMALRSDVEVVELRGNVPTRIRKVDDEQVHAAILAAAGLHRLDVHQRISSYLDAPAWLPAAGQGAIAVQIRSDDETVADLIRQLDHAETRTSTVAERTFLGALEGGCQVPIGALAIGAALHGFISDLRGERVLRGSVPLDRNDPGGAGRRLADQLRAKGAAEILRGLERVTNAPAPQPE